MYLGNQMVTPVIVGAEENPLFPIKNGVITKNVSQGITASGVKEIGDSGLYGSFWNQDISSGAQLVIGEVSFPDLERIENYGLFATFRDQYEITKASFPKLKYIGNQGCSNAFRLGFYYTDCEFDFSSLENFGSNAFKDAFRQREIDYIIFPALKAENFVNESDLQFSYMLTGVSNCIVYFPSSLEQAIGSWSVILNGFNGTNTSVYFWVPTKITPIIEQSGATLITTDKVFNGVILATGNTARFVVNDGTNNKNDLIAIPDCPEGGEPRTINIDMDSYSYDKVTIRANVGLSETHLLWHDIEIPLVQENTNVYSTYINKSIGEELVISIDETYSSPASTTQITTIGTDIDETIVVPIYEDFTRPNLSSNGTIGGDSFAVLNKDNTSDANVYKAFDGDTSTYWQVSNGGLVTLEFYNPVPFRIGTITASYTSSSYKISSFGAVFGSNDESGGWKQIAGSSYSGTNETYFFPSSGQGFYKYYYAIMFGSNTARIKEFGIEGKVYPDAS